MSAATVTNLAHGLSGTKFEQRIEHVNGQLATGRNIEEEQLLHLIHEF